MTKRKAKPKPPEFRVWLKPAVHNARKRLPGRIRQRMKRLFDELGRNPYPAKCRDLRLPDNVPNSIKADWKVRRVQLDDWRVVYAVSETWHEIAVLTVEKRPPYDYEDLEALLSDLA